MNPHFTTADGKHLTRRHCNPSTGTVRFITTNPLKTRFLGGILALAMVFSIPASEQDAQHGETLRPAQPEESGSADLAKKLANPMASLVSVPFQNNFDFGGGFDGNAFRYSLHIQPVVPIPLGEDWNLIVRPILPFVHQTGVFPDATVRTPRGSETRTISGTQTGLSDMLLEVFVGPSNPLPGGFLVGVGPVALFPTATETLLGTGKYGLGPTGVILRQSGGLTYGTLAYQLWSVGGNANRRDVSSLFLQPFVSYTTKTATTFMLDTESSYDWVDGEWTVPINASVSQILKLGRLPVSFQFGVRYYATAPDHGPDWGLRFTITPLLPGF